MVQKLSTYFGFILISFMLLSSTLIAQKSVKNLSNSDYSQNLLNRFKEMSAAGSQTTLEIPQRAKNNKTMLLVEIKKNWDKLTANTQSAFNSIMSRPIGLPQTYSETDENYFKFYYTTTGSNAVSTTDANSNGTPDYVENMADAFVKALSFYDSLGYNRPPLVASDNGRFSVYISNEEAGDYVYGYTQPENYIGDNPLTSIVEIGSVNSFMVMRNNYIGFGNTATELQIAMEVTAAHEFFHAVQFGYEFDNMEGYLMEMCSAWAEDKVYPGDDDNWQYLYDIFETPDVSLDWDEYLDGDPVYYDSDYSMHWYAAWIFMRYITDYFGDEIPKFIYENNITNSTSTSIDKVMKSNGTSYTEMLKDFYIAIGILTSSQTTPMSYYSFERANEYRTVTKNSGGYPTGPFVVNYENTLNYSGTKVSHSSTSNGNKRLMRASADYIKINPSTNFSIVVAPKIANANFTVRLIKSDSYTNPTSLEVVEPTILGSNYLINVSDNSAYNSYVLVIYNTKYSTDSSRDTTSIQYDVTIDAALLTNGVQLTAPVGGELWQVGSIHNITWNSANVTDVKLEYSTNNGITWNSIVDSTKANLGSFTWTVPSTISDSCKVKISDINDTAYTSISTNMFSIIAPLPFSLISPNGGEEWQVGSNHDITWNKGTVSNIIIELTTDGNSWSIISDSTSAAVGQFTWTVPNSLSALCKIRISDVTNASVNSVSENYFSIIPKAIQVTVLSEDFVKVTSGSVGSPGSVDLSNTLDTYTLEGGWTGAKIFAAGGAMKIGSSSGFGYIVTPTLDLSSNEGNGTINFDLQTFSNDTKVMQVFLSTDNGNSYTQVGDDITPTASMVTQSIPFTGGTNISKIKLSASVSASNRFYVDNIIVISSAITAIGNHENSRPTGFILSQNYPNPFNPSTKISFTMPKHSHVTIKVYDILGNEVATLVNEEKPQGNYTIEFNAKNLVSGVYFYTLKADSFSDTKKLLLLK